MDGAWFPPFTVTAHLWFSIAVDDFKEAQLKTYTWCATPTTLSTRSRKHCIFKLFFDESIKSLLCGMDVWIQVVKVSMLSNHWKFYTVAYLAHSITFFAPTAQFFMWSLRRRKTSLWRHIEPASVINGGAVWKYRCKNFRRRNANFVAKSRQNFEINADCSRFKSNKNRPLWRSDLSSKWWLIDAKSGAITSLVGIAFKSWIFRW